MVDGLLVGWMDGLVNGSDWLAGWLDGLVGWMDG
jgi:hypothetical protein